MPDLFKSSNLMGTFKGFIEKGYEFAAEIVTPYNADMLDKPQLGQFLLIQLDSPEEASLGRITKFIPAGLLATVEGEDYINTMQRRDQEVPEDLKEAKLKYRVAVKLLGAVKISRPANESEKIIFVPSQRRLPHLGAKVALPSDDVLREICSLSEGKTDLGDYALGEFIFSDASCEESDIFRNISPSLPVKFNINNLVAKRSVVFARAGYGKSNLIKYLISELYKNNGENAVTDRQDKVGTLIFDVDGEYFWPDHKGRPGLCDVPDLHEQIVLFTNRRAPNDYYGHWKAGEVKLDIRNLPARDVIGIAVSSDRQEQQNVLKLKGMHSDRWAELVDLIREEGLQAADDKIGKLMGYNDVRSAAAEIAAARSNMNNVARLLHDPDSKLIDQTLYSLKRGKVVVIDISLLSSAAGNNIAGLMMRRIFSYNQEHFTGGQSPIPVNVIIEEAQSVLGKRLEESSPFVEWVKEGRKYDLGAILITQQPGSLAPEIMSQADNWFCFHLLSEGDVSVLGRYNSHYSHDVLSHIIGEPIPGNCYMWSAPKQPFVLPVRIKSFEELYKDGVKSDDSATPAFVSPREGIESATEKRNQQLAENLLAIIKRDKNKLSKKEDVLSGVPQIGLYQGQLFYFIQEAKRDVDSELRGENALFLPVLGALFECEPQVMKSQHPDKGEQNYYFVPKAEWDRKVNG